MKRNTHMSIAQLAARYLDFSLLLVLVVQRAGALVSPGGLSSTKQANHLTQEVADDVSTFLLNSIKIQWTTNNKKKQPNTQFWFP